MTTEIEDGQTLDCGGPCTHTNEAHAAFDQGVMAGSEGEDANANPYAGDADLWEAWATGHSVTA